MLRKFRTKLPKIDMSRIPFYLLSGYIFFVFLTGGGSRADISSLIILRPISIILCFYAIWNIEYEQIKRYRFILGVAALIFATVVLQLIPLPPSLWKQLPGREIIAEIDFVTELGEVWRPLSMTPSETWNALYSLFVPLAVLLLVVQLTREHKFQLLFIFLGLGLISGFLSILQIIGDPKGPSYLYQITNNGQGVGLFANRNHQAAMMALLFPFLAVYASSGIKNEMQWRFRCGLAFAVGAALIPLLLITGSRAGLGLGLLGLLSTVFLYKKPDIGIPSRRGAKIINWKYPTIVFACFCLVALTVIMSRAQALQRLFDRDPSEDLRFSTFDIVLKQAMSVFPFGSGYGSFPDIYKVIEADSSLSPSYFNHAHNDWLELFLTGGAPALLILALVTIAFIKRSHGAFWSKISLSRNVAYGRLGAVIIFLLALASIVDYPLRVPSIMCLFVIAAIWLQDTYIVGKKKAGAL